MAGRRLSPDERAVWAAVARSVRAADSRTRPPAEAPSVAVTTKPAAAPRARIAKGVGETLDGSWDRRIASGRIAPERTIDLHGCTLDQAYLRLSHELDRAVADGVRVVLLITGRAPRRATSRLDAPLRGIIRASVGDWLAASRHARHIAAIRSAHPQHGGAGALYLVLRRVRTT